ncbi:hypothetical protein OROGR_018208 [Orobanche gracilis]
MAATSKKPVIRVGVCNLLMAALFAISASFQFNDSDWYFWIPLYAIACLVNLVSWGENPTSRVRKMARFALCLGLFLFVKVVMEEGMMMMTGFWSSNMRERNVREKFGSGLVITSMLLLLLQNSNPHPTPITKYDRPVRDADPGGRCIWPKLHFLHISTPRNDEVVPINFDRTRLLFRELVKSRKKDESTC